DDGAPFDYAAKFNLSYDDEDEEYDEDDDETGGMPRPSFGSLTSIGGIRKTERAPVLPEVPEEERSYPEIDLEDVHADLDGLSTANSPEEDAEEPGPDDWPAAEVPEDAEPAPATEQGPAFAAASSLDAVSADEPSLPELSPDDMELGDWLASAREMAAA